MAVHLNDNGIVSERNYELLMDLYDIFGLADPDQEEAFETILGDYQNERIKE